MEVKDYNIDEFVKALYMSKSTFERKLVAICEKYDIDNSLMQIDNIKKVPVYSFKKEWVQELYLLFEIFDKNPFSRTNYAKSLNEAFDQKLEYNIEIINTVDSLQDGAIKTEIKSSAAYLTKLIENKLLQNISRNLSSISNFLSTTDSFFRFKILNELNGFFEMLNEYLVYREAIYYVSAEKESEYDVPEHTLNSHDNIDGYTYNDFDIYVAELLKNKLGKVKDADINKNFFQSIESVDKDFDNIVEGFFVQTVCMKIYDAFNRDIMDFYSKSEIPLNEKNEEAIFFDLYLDAFKNETRKCNVIFSQITEKIKPLANIINDKSVLGVNRIKGIIDIVISHLGEMIESLSHMKTVCFCYFKKGYNDSDIKSFARYLKDFIDITCLKSVMVDKYLEFETYYSYIYQLKIVNNQLIKSLSANADNSKNQLSDEEIISALSTITNAHMFSQLFDTIDNQMNFISNTIIEYTISITRMTNRFVDLYNVGDTHNDEIKQIMRSVIKEENLDPKLKERIKTSLANDGLNSISKSYIFDIFNQNK